MRTVLIIVFAVSMVACTTQKKIQTVQLRDNKLSCKEIEQEYAKLDEAEEGISGDKSMSEGKNIAAALFWLPGLAYTYYDAGEAEKLIRERRSHLTNLYNDKDCG